MSRDWQLFLADIIEHAERVERLLRGRDLGSLEGDETLRQAILFSLLIIGEATKQLPQWMRDAEPSVNWRGAAGLLAYGRGAVCGRMTAGASDT